jgi:hypothetical protein
MICMMIDPQTAPRLIPRWNHGPPFRLIPHGIRLGVASPADPGHHCPPAPATRPPGSRIAESTQSMTRKRAHHGHGWTPSDLRKLRTLVARGTPRAEIARTLGRTVAAVYQRIVTEQLSPRAPASRRRRAD